MIPASSIYELEYWQKRAQETRTLAGSLKDVKSKQTMLRIADNYDRLVAQVKERETAKPTSVLPGQGFHLSPRAANIIPIIVAAKANQRRKGEDLLRRQDPKRYKIHQISPRGEVTGLPDLRFATLQAAKRYVRPTRLVAIYKDRSKIWPRR
jgi:hypothetical protein